MTDQSESYNILFGWGVVFLALAIVLTYFGSGKQFLAALIALILLTTSYVKYANHMRSLAPPPQPPYAEMTLSFEPPPLKDHSVVKFTLTVSYPTNAKEDDIRFTIPKSIRDRAFLYLSTLTTFPDRIEFEEYLVKYARELSNQLHIPPINLSVTIDNPQRSPNSGIIIGYTE